MAAAGRLRPVVTLALALAFPAVGLSRRDVLELGNADFDYLAAEHDTMLVKFYAPWCAHCKKLAPEFDKAASQLKGTVQLAKVTSLLPVFRLCLTCVCVSQVDCTAHVDTCTRFGVTGYPTLRIFRNGRDSASYGGPRSAEGICQYMKKQTGPDSLSLMTGEDLQTFIDHYDASIVGVFSGEESPRLSEFLKAAGLLRDQFRFAHTTQMNLSSPYGLHSEGVLLFRPPRLSNQFEDNVVIFKDFLTISSLRRFIRDHIFGLCPHMTLENKDHLQVRDLLTAFYHLDYKHNPRGSNYWRNRVMKVASKFVGRGLTFSVANKKDFQSELEDDFGLGTSDSRDLPLVTIRTKVGYKYTMREEFTRDGQSLDRFLNDYFTERLKRYIKSESVPEKPSGAVQVVVAELFEAIVNDPTKDVLIQFYSPSCPHCKKLQPVYTQLAEMLSADPAIVIAKMNAIDNDVPLGYDVQGYPTFYLAPADRKDQPVRYEGGRELRDFLHFLRREASHSASKQEL